MTWSGPGLGPLHCLLLLTACGTSWSTWCAASAVVLQAALSQLVHLTRLALGWPISYDSLGLLAPLTGNEGLCQGFKLMMDQLIARPL